MKKTLKNILMTVVLVVGFQVHAAAVTLITDDRILSIYGEVSEPSLGRIDTYSSTVTPLTDFSVFDESLSDTVDLAGALFGYGKTQGSSSQTSSVTPLSYTGSGNANLDLTPDTTIAVHGISESIFNVQFTIDSPYRYNIAGNVACDSNWLIYGASVSLLSEFDVINEFSGNEIFDVSGVLETGTYTLIGVASVHDLESLPSQPSPGYGSASYDFSLDLAPVPVPAAIWLFGSGLIGLMGVAKRKKS